MIRKTPPLDRDKVKIASFRITEGEWFDFTEAADRQNVTATDVIKGAIQLFMDGKLELPDVNYVSTAVNTSLPFTRDDIQTMIDETIEQSIAPIQTHLAELLGQVAELRGMMTDTKPKAQTAPKPNQQASLEPDAEVLKLANRLKADTGLQKAVRVCIASNLTGKALCERLLELGYGAKDNSKLFDASVAGRFIKAIAYLDNEGHG